MRTGLLRHLRYPAAFLLFAFLCLVLVVTVNLLVDPLWYFSGTRLGHQNAWMNERTSKINLIKQEVGSYDCLIFGSSVTTLLDSSKIRGYNCFNAAFADARVEEFAIYARYLKRLGLRPKLVILDLLPMNFASARRREINLPEFILNNRPPAPPLRSYLSLQVLEFSLQSLLGAHQQSRYYDERFVVELTRPTEPVGPALALELAPRYDGFTTEPLGLYAEFLKVWPHARRVGFASFTNAWIVADWRRRGILESYLRTVYEAAGLFDEFYDFTAPSRLTTDLKRSNDGVHYGSDTYDFVAARINGDEEDIGIAVHEMSYQQFKERYLRQVEALPAEIVEYVDDVTAIGTSSAAYSESRSAHSEDPRSSVALD